MVIFYTSVEGIEPAVFCYPYIVVNPWCFYEAVRYIEICRDRVKSILVDTGVDKLFKQLNVRDYPEWYIARYVQMVRTMVARYGNRIEIIYTIPDIPVDYEGRENLYPWNVQRTVEYIEMFRSRYIDYLRPAKPMPVVQGKKDDIMSVLDTYRRYEHLYNEFEIIGLGPTCHTKKWSALSQMILIFDRNVSRPFHSFGAHLKAIERVLKWRLRYFRSFDSSAYFWINEGGRWRKTNGRKERTPALIQYIERLRKLGIEVE